MVRSPILLIPCCLALLLGSAALADDLVYSVPAWFTDDVEFSTRAGGRWISSNAEYKSTEEPWDYYVMQWQAGPGNYSMFGRMSAIKDNTPSNGDFWAFSQYWNPATGQAVVQQNGWGSVGIGQLRQSSGEEDNVIEMVQVFTTFTGESSETGHRVKRIDDATYDTWSFTFDDAGNQVAGRYYRWVRNTQP